VPLSVASTIKTKQGLKTIYFDKRDENELFDIKIGTTIHGH
jgi:hypothetical protein